MLLALNDIKIPKEWYHNPRMENMYGESVADI